METARQLPFAAPGAADPDSPGFESALRREFDAVLAGAEFVRSPTLSRLLRYLVEQTIAGNGDRLKAYSIAVEGLGRADNFDTQHDSYPRVQMVRLRKALEAHYAETRPVGEALYLAAGSYRVRMVPHGPTYLGSTDGPVPIAIDDGTGQTPLSLAAPRASTGWRYRRPALIIAALLAVIAALLSAWYAGRQSGTALAAALQTPTVEIEVTGAELPDLTAVARDTLLDGLERSWTAQVRADGSNRSAAVEGKADYRARVRIAPAVGGRVMISGQTVDLTNSTVISSGRITVPADPESVVNALAPIITRVGGPYGAIADAERARLAKGDRGGYACLLRYFDFVKIRTPALRERVAKCLAMPIDEPRLAASVLAARSFFTLEWARAGQPSTRYAEATRFARQALEADPNDARANFAMARMAYIANDCAAGNFHTSRAVQANSYDPLSVTILAGLSFPCGYPGAGALLDRAVMLGAGQETVTRTALVLAAIGQDRIESLSQLDDGAGFAPLQRPTDPVELPAYLLAETLIASADGRTEEARRRWIELSALLPDMGRAPQERLKSVVLSPTLRARVIELLAKRKIIPSLG